MKDVCVIGNFSGRNTGDAAILGCLLRDVEQALGPCRFMVPTINKGFVSKQYAKHEVVPIGLLPWNLSVKIFGLPILRAVMSADVVLVTDAILFDYKLLNPLYNYLSTLALVLPLAKRRGIPVVLYNVSLGPVYTPLGRRCLRRVLDSSPLILLRDEESRELIAREKLDCSGAAVHRTADCALTTVPSLEGRLRGIEDRERLFKTGRHWISFNINSYIDVYVRGYKGEGVGRDRFTSLMGEVLDRVIDELGVDVVVPVTQPMDLPITEEVLGKAINRDRAHIFTNREHTYEDFAGIFNRVEMHLGMRTHSLILAASVLTPVIAIIATPKNRGFMRSIEQDERMVEFCDLTADHLFNVLCSTWENRQQIRLQIEPIIAREKQKAASAAEYLSQFLGQPETFSAKTDLIVK